jgi:hypothetical protein
MLSGAPSASATPFVETGEDLPTCPQREGGREEVLISNDGDTAVWAQCVYTRGETGWTMQTELAGFPDAMSADGNTLLEEPTLFVRSSESWTEEELPEADCYGCAEAISGDGNTVVYGSGNEHVTVYARSAGMWHRQAIINQPPQKKPEPCVPPGPGCEHALIGFGRAAALSSDGNTMILGAFGAEHYRGFAYVYTRSGETWSLQATLVGSERRGRANFGDAVALSADGNTALVSGVLDRGSHGAVWAFGRSGESWTQQAKLTSGGLKKEAWFGQSLALTPDGNTALIGAGGLGARRTRAGAAFLFERAGETWTAAQTLAPPESKVGDEFGSSVALSADGKTALLYSAKKSEPPEPRATFVTVWSR